MYKKVNNGNFGLKQPCNVPFFLEVIRWQGLLKTLSEMRKNIKLIIITTITITIAFMEAQTPKQIIWRYHTTNFKTIL